MWIGRNILRFLGCLCFLEHHCLLCAFKAGILVWMEYDSVVDITHLVLTLSLPEFLHIVTTLESCAQGALQTLCAWAAGTANTQTARISSVHMCAPLSHQTSLTQVQRLNYYKCQYSSSKALNQIETPSEHRTLCNAAGHMPWSCPCPHHSLTSGTSHTIHSGDCWYPERENNVPRVTQRVVELELKPSLCLIRLPVWPVWHDRITTG